jgi:hypothetical protein NreA
MPVAVAARLLGSGWSAGFDKGVESAVMNAKKALIHDHIDHCLDLSIRAPGRKGTAALRELKAVTKYL